MLKRIDLRRSTADPRGLLPRAKTDVSEAVAHVRPIVEAVRLHGAAAVRDATSQWDGVTLTELGVPADVIARAVEALDPEVRAALAVTIERARAVHQDQRRTDITTQVAPGGVVTERFVPVARAGLYVPGGLAVYPSSVVMNVVPAQVAGVTATVVCSPPQKETGLPDARVLAACGLLGVDEVYAVGGAQAIAMFAYGTDDTDEPPASVDLCPPVDLITGPGNIWVAAAKRLVRGVVGIDSEAGPTEIAILADETADPRHVASDLISQAEHDPLAASVLVTTSSSLADAVDVETAARVAATKHSDRVAEALSGPQSASVLVDDLDTGLALLNAYGAEHLEIQTREARSVASRVTSAGAVFLGAYSPVSLGDYAAGSNHVLPTGGCARHSGGLTVQTFLKGMQVIEYDAAALATLAPHVIALADAEDLPAHGEAITARIQADTPGERDGGESGEAR